MWSITRRAAIAAAATAIAALTVGAGSANAANDRHGDGPGNAKGRPYTVGLFGDMPYGPQGRVEYPRLLADMNTSDIEFSIFDGDLKAGGDGTCDDALYSTSLASFNTLKRPVVVLPGDNDWTDCWGRYGAGTGGFDALERLDHERQVFYPTDQTLGRHTMTVQRESSEPGYEKYRENVRWVYGPVMYIGLNVQGSNDNLPHAGVDGENRPDSEIARMTAEHQERERANIHWLSESYALAAKQGLKGVMVAWQADPNFNNEQKLQPAQYDGYNEILPELRKQVLAFPGQSALVHGDSHYFKLDKPMKYDNGQVVAKFTRVETFGDGNTHWVSATVDPHDPNLFEFTPKIVAANVADR
ncbi:hypothetical protein JOL79_14875 [Microbispora sp. RL4-1S]|uniref:Calcineurin-like phosphoesterase domain-containing protein n=1 Tax=Microbispora oryzae TaxID=2806554 RepID=A0A940WKQ8_9ACTN|nr:hypothetical protein [Microbispora oryzae]MBP2705097.1 hypothetical protein [Microbispora oryzae]